MATTTAKKREPIRLTVRQSELLDRPIVSPYHRQKKKQKREKILHLSEATNIRRAHFSVCNIIGLVSLFIYLILTLLPLIYCGLFMTYWDFNSQKLNHGGVKLDESHRFNDLTVNQFNSIEEIIKRINLVSRYIKEICLIENINCSTS